MPRRQYFTSLIGGMAILPIALVYCASPAAATSSARSAAATPSYVDGIVCTADFRSHRGHREAEACVAVDISATQQSSGRATAWIHQVSGPGSPTKAEINHLNLKVANDTVKHVDFVHKATEDGRAEFYTGYYNHRYEVVHAGVYHICIYWSDGDYACAASDQWLNSHNVRLR